MIAGRTITAAAVARRPADVIGWAAAQHPRFLRPQGFLTLVALGEDAVPVLAEALDLAGADRVFALTAAPVDPRRLTDWVAAPDTPVASGPGAADALDAALATAWLGDQVVVFAPAGTAHVRLDALTRAASPAEVFVIAV
jgi:hypothetical protein